MSFYKVRLVIYSILSVFLSYNSMGKYHWRMTLSIKIIGIGRPNVDLLFFKVTN